VRGRASGATSSCDHACSKAGRRLHRPFPLRPRRPPVTRLRCFCLRRAGPALRHRSHDASSLGRDRGGTVPAGRSSRSTSRSSDRDQQGVCPGVPARKGNAAVRPATRIEDAHACRASAREGEHPGAAPRTVGRLPLNPRDFFYGLLGVANPRASEERPSPSAGLRCASIYARSLG
jgi:hypothetical protein